MKPLIIFKYVDIIGQALALIIPFAIWHDGEGLLIGWISLGAAQTLSAFINKALLNKVYKSKARVAYEIIIATLIIAYSLILLFGLREYHTLFALLQGICGAIAFSSPLLAVWYFIMSGAEISRIRNSQPL